MTKTESIIHSILGPRCGDVRPFACAIDVAVDQLFSKKLPLDELKLSKHIFPIAAEQMRMSVGALERSMERMANRCWESGDKKELKRIIGKELTETPYPREMLIYLAFYSGLGEPYYSAVARTAALTLPLK